MNIPTKHSWLALESDHCALEWTAAVLRSVPGREVLACDNPQLALEVLFAEPESFELMITDTNMPGLDDLELARAMYQHVS